MEKNECGYNAAISQSDKVLFCCPKYDYVNCREPSIKWYEITKEEFEQLAEQSDARMLFNYGLGAFFDAFCKSIYLDKLCIWLNKKLG